MLNISFDNEHINEQLVEYILAMEFLRCETTSFRNNPEYTDDVKIDYLKSYEEDYEGLKQKLLNDQEIVKVDKDVFEL